MKRKRMMTYIPALLIMAFLAGSCETIIKFRGDGGDPRIVIYTLLHSDSLIKVSVAVSHAVFDEKYEVEQITNAVVRVYRDGVLLETLDYVPPVPVPEYQPAITHSRYVSEVNRPVPGSTYKIEVEVPGLTTASGSAMLPDPVPIIRIDTTFVISEWGERQMEVKIKFLDPAGTENLYRLTARGISGVYYGPKEEPYSPLMPVMVTDEDLSYGASDEPLITPNQGDDIFGMELYNNYTLFTDELISGKEYSLTMHFYYKAPDTDYYEFDHTYFMLNTLSRDLYLYLQSLSAQAQTRDNFLAEPVLVYTNITNGLGVVGAISTGKDSLKIGDYPVEGVYYESYSYGK